jgi:hypothetical protein
VIARLLLAVSLVLLVAAPGPALAEVAQAAQIELADEPAPLADDEAVTPPAAARATARACAARPSPPEEPPPPRLARSRIFRPPRSSFD